MAAQPPPDAETRVVPPEPEPGPSRGLGWGMLLGALLLVALAAAGAAVYFATRDDDGGSAAPATTTAPTTTRNVQVLAAGKVFVPDVTGLRQDDAVARLGAAHLVPVIQFQPTKKATGKVVAQQPKAAAKVKRGSSVQLTVDKGAAKVAVPDVSGLKVAAAKATLKEAGLKAQTTGVTAPGKPAGTVVSQAPAAGDEAAKGTSVTLSVAKEGTEPRTTTQAATTTTTQEPQQSTTATVPDLAGMDVQAASQALSAAGLKASLAYVPGEDRLGTVVAQTPAAGATAPARSHVTVNASEGPNAKDEATVPDTVGQTLQQAVSTLNGAGLRLIFVKVPVTTQASIGKIVEQTPAAGKTAPEKAQVLVYLGVKG
jgi:serine/threonine-protein kinase